MKEWFFFPSRLCTNPQIKHTGHEIGKRFFQWTHQNVNKHQQKTPVDADRCLISRWEDLPVLKNAQVRSRCRRGWLLKAEGSAVSYAQEEACVSASELSPGRHRGQPVREEGSVKVRSQQRSSTSRSSLSGRQPVRKTKITQVRGTVRVVVEQDFYSHGGIISSCSVWRNMCILCV